MNTLKNWLASKKGSWLIVGVVLVLLVIFALTSRGGEYLNLVGSAGASCDETPLAQNPNLGMIQAAWGINVRIGPGQNYDYVNPSKMGLPKCTIFELLGRNADSTWPLVTSEKENLAGWIATGQTWDGTPWEKINMDINTLPVSNTILGSQNASGGQSGTNKGIVVSIEKNLASVSVSGLPANDPFYVTLAPSGISQKGILFYNGYADANGKAYFQSSMPLKWSDGSKVESGTLVMMAFATKTGEQVGYVSLQYYR